MTRILFPILFVVLANIALAEDAPKQQEGATISDYTYTAKIVKVSGTKLTVHSFRGHSGIIHDEETDAKTLFERDGKAAKLEDFKAGDWVKISWNKDPKRIVKVESTKGLWDDQPAEAKKKEE